MKKTYLDIVVISSISSSSIITTLELTGHNIIVQLLTGKILQGNF